MIEVFNEKNQKRVFFPKNKQRSFLLKAYKESKLSWNILSKKLDVSIRAINDWKNEKYSIPLKAIEKLCCIANLKFPDNIQIKERFWYTKIGGKIAGNLLYKRYGIIGGNPEARKQKWLEWWNKLGKFNLPKNFISINIKKPRINKDLAEFFGIMIGDGGMSKYQLNISLNYKTDKNYIIFVKSLIKKVFKVDPAIHRRQKQSLDNIVISRIQLVKFCNALGLKTGNKLKQNLDIPEWIKKNKEFAIVCVRGIMDTDGCVFNECHKIKNKKYCYPRLSLVSASSSLRISVFKILKDLQLNPAIRNNRSVQIENKEDIKKYFKIIGTNNDKHKIRFNKIMEESDSGLFQRS